MCLPSPLRWAHEDDLGIRRVPVAARRLSERFCERNNTQLKQLFSLRTVFVFEHFERQCVLMNEQNFKLAENFIGNELAAVSLLLCGEQHICVFEEKVVAMKTLN